MEGWERGLIYCWVGSEYSHPVELHRQYWWYKGRAGLPITLTRKTEKKQNKTVIRKIIKLIHVILL